MRAMLIDVYTRAQAIEDGVLVDVSTMAKEAGFKWPVAITNGVHGVLRDIPEQFSHQDYTGRLWDVLFMAAMAVRRNRKCDEIRYKVICQHEIENDDGDMEIKRELLLKMVIHPGDDMEPVLTIDRLR